MNRLLSRLTAYFGGFRQSSELVLVVLTLGYVLLKEEIGVV